MLKLPCGKTAEQNLRNHALAHESTTVRHSMYVLVAHASACRAWPCRPPCSLRQLQSSPVLWPANGLIVTSMKRCAAELRAAGTQSADIVQYPTGV